MLTGALLVAPPVLSAAGTHQQAQQATGAPKILLDQSPRAIEYQLGRLTDDELMLVERKDDDPRYRLVYFALLTRKGLAAQFRDEALAALTKLDKSTPSRVLLEALGKTPADQQLAGAKLLGMLFAQPASALQADRSAFAQAIESPAGDSSFQLQGAYGALLLADGTPAQVLPLAENHEGHVVQLLRAVRELPAGPQGDGVRQQLQAPIAKLAAGPADAAARSEALATLGWVKRDAATFESLAGIVVKEPAIEIVAPAVRSLTHIPENAWPASGAEPLARAIVQAVSKTPTERRTDEDVLDVLQFGERMSTRLPDEAGRGIRRELRALGVRVVKIQSIPEKLSFDLRWFAVEAGKPVQIVLFNPDAMPHNLVIGKPDSLEMIANAAATLPMPADPNAKAFVPDLPVVLESTRLVKEGETERLRFAAPKEPGAYNFVCTFPGHWVRMYGVMLVVDSLDSWEAKPTVPIDPMTKQPFTSERNPDK
jgi:uncharacterized cupredoxin-like copper-binding protein